MTNKPQALDEQMIAQMRDAIWREDHYNPKLCGHSGNGGDTCAYCEPHDDDTPDAWPADKERAERQARAAHSLMAAKVAELEAGIEAAFVKGADVAVFIANQRQNPQPPTTRQLDGIAELLAAIRAALAPHPEGEHG